MSTDPIDEGRPPSDVLLNVAEAATELLHVVFLDKLWRQALESPVDFSDRGEERLLELGNKVGDTIATADQHVSTIRDFFAHYPAWTDEHLSGALASKDLPAHQRERLEQILSTEGNYAERGIALGDSLIRQLPDAGAVVHRKVNAFRTDIPGATELTVSDDEFTPSSTACGVLALATMASLILCPETGLSCVGAFIGGAALVHYCS